MIFSEQVLNEMLRYLAFGFAFWLSFTVGKSVRASLGTGWRGLMGWSFVALISWAMLTANRDGEEKDRGMGLFLACSLMSLWGFFEKKKFEQVWDDIKHEEPIKQEIWQRVQAENTLKIAIGAERGRRSE
jgi:hypothetical protein